LAKEISQQSLALLIRDGALPDERNSAFDERVALFVTRWFFSVTVAIALALLRLERNRSTQLRKPSIENMKLFRLNRGERQPHSHTGFRIDHIGVRFEGPLLTGDAQLHARLQRERAKRINIASASPQVADSCVQHRSLHPIDSLHRRRKRISRISAALRALRRRGTDAHSHGIIRHFDTTLSANNARGGPTEEGGKPAAQTRQQLPV
jgi:hypothetical protein